MGRVSRPRTGKRNYNNAGRRPRRGTGGCHLFLWGKHRYCENIVGVGGAKYCRVHRRGRDQARQRLTVAQRKEMNKASKRVYRKFMKWKGKKGLAE